MKSVNSGEESDPVAGPVGAALEKLDQHPLPKWFPHQDNGFSIHPETAKFLIALLSEIRPRRVAEFGSGASTRLIVQAIRETGDEKVITVDHLALCSRNAIDELDEHEKKIVEAVVFPVRPRLHLGKLLFFYQIPQGFWKGRDPFDFVFVDGPPSTWRREAALYEVFDHLAPGAYLLLDDLNRSSLEGEDFTAWESHYGASVITHRLDGIGRGIGIVQKVGKPAGTARFPLNEVFRRWVSGIFKIIRFGWGAG